MDGLLFHILAIVVMASIFGYVYFRKTKDLKEKNITLEEANLEIQALYEQMAAAEETLRYNYDELSSYQERLEEERFRYHLILKASKESFWDYRPLTKAFEIANTFLGSHRPIFSVEDFLTFVHPEDRKLLYWFEDSKNDICPEVYEVDARVAVDKDRYRWHHFIGIVVKDKYGTINRIVGSISDVHEANIQRERISFYAFHDSVTGLYNLDYLLETVGNYLTERQSNQKAIMLVAGAMDYSKMIGIYGDTKTEILLFQLSATLKSVFCGVEEISSLSRGRFAVWLKNELTNEALQEAIDAIESQIKNFMYYELLNADFGFVYGAVLVDQNIGEASITLQRAEIAFEEAEKKRKSGEVIWFDKTMQEKKERASTVEIELRRAVVREELYLVYQPQYTDYDRTEIRAYEALIRWQNERLGMVPPDEFISLAEENGLIYEIGRFVITSVCQLISEYKTRHNRDIKIAINASFKELVREDYVGFLLQCAETYQVSPRQIHIEITETAISAYIDAVISHLNLLRAYGFEIHMDDFGTGYSSLNQLGRLPINVLKIDRSFVSTLAMEPKMQDLTALIIEIGHRYHMKIIAEGVENKEQYRLLKAMGCDYYQGYGLSKPISQETLMSE